MLLDRQLPENAQRISRFLLGDVKRKAKDVKIAVDHRRHSRLS
jgi:hypothetical protein